MTGKIVDRAFLLGILSKGVLGLGQLALGLTVLTLGHVPFVALAQGTTMLAAWYLVLHGAVKVPLVAALLRGYSWAYPAMLLALFGFIATQTVEAVLNPGIGLWALSAFDAVMVVLTWLEWRKQRAARVAGPDASDDGAGDAATQLVAQGRQLL